MFNLESGGKSATEWFLDRFVEHKDKIIWLTNSIQRGMFFRENHEEDLRSMILFYYCIVLIRHICLMRCMMMNVSMN